MLLERWPPKKLMTPFVLALLSSAALHAHVPAPADMVLIHGRIYTADGRRSMAEALAVRAGKIVYVGGTSGVRVYVGRSTEQVDAEGRLVLPGLVDAHIHPTLIADLDVCSLDHKPLRLEQIGPLVKDCI